MNSSAGMSRAVSRELQEQFAALCGDRNPMHMDLVAARRTQAGSPVVHGVHNLLWMLETLLETQRMVSPLVRMKVKFVRWVYPGDKVTLHLPSSEEVDPRTVSVNIGDMPILSAQLYFGKATEPKAVVALRASPVAPRTKALDLTFLQLEDLAGDAFTAPASEAARMFPRLSAAVGAGAVAEIAACSYIVGMEAPGLHSMFSKLDLTFHHRDDSNAEPDSARRALHYEVAYHDERFRKAQIAVRGAFIEGTLDVFVRVPPVEQPNLQTISHRVEPSAFRGMRALIIGGSRGLGELTAKLIAAGGGDVAVTYTLGEAEANRLVGEIQQWGGTAQSLKYDVRLSPQSQLAALKLQPTHLFYFATSMIFRPKPELVTVAALSEFITFYIQGFHDLCVALVHSATSTGGPAKKLVAFYPSTAFVEERPKGMTEYAMVKAAGEQMCKDMSQYITNLDVLTIRLPRLPTDQTAGVVPERELDPVSILLDVIRRMQSAG